MMHDAIYPRPKISKEEYDRPDFWEIYLVKVADALPVEEGRKRLATILCDYYEVGAYEDALAKIAALVAAKPSALEVAWPYMKFCREVSGKLGNPEDGDKARAHRRWLTWRDLLPGWLFKSLFRLRFIACKHCGRYTKYIDPNEGVAYLDLNNCQYCKRGYPMPSLMWDSVGGQAYMFYRRSVSECAFYDGVRESFELVNPNNEEVGGKPPPGF